MLSIEDGVVFYHVEVLLAQVWKLKKRYSDFDEMHRKLRRDLDPINLPKLPEKKYLFSMNHEFIESRMRSLHEYLKSIILIYEALENPILQRFLEIDITYDPNFEYLPIAFQKQKEVKLIPRSRKLSDHQNETQPVKSQHLDITRNSRKSRKDSTVSMGSKKRRSKRKESDKKLDKAMNKSLKSNY